MVDPDHPSLPSGTYYLHWVLSNIPVSLIFIFPIERVILEFVYRDTF